MTGWMMENLGNILVCAILLVIVALIVYRMAVNKKKKKSSCTGDCSSCSGCH